MTPVGKNRAQVNKKNLNIQKFVSDCLGVDLPNLVGCIGIFHQVDNGIFGPFVIVGRRFQSFFDIDYLSIIDVAEVYK